MSNPNDFQYIESKAYMQLPVIEINDPKSFTRFANANEVKFMFRIMGEGTSEFFFPHEHVLYKLNGNGYRTLADMAEAVNGNFTDVEIFYKAKAMGIPNQQEYADFGEKGLENKEEYETARKAGFVDGLTEFKKKYPSYKDNPLMTGMPEDLDHPVKLHKYSVEKGMKTFADFIKIYDAGFPDVLTYHDGSVRQFTDGKTYHNARSRNLENLAEYNKAMKIGLENKKELLEYDHLNDLNKNRMLTHDKLQLLVALSNLNNGEVIPLLKVKELLEKEQERFKKVSPASPEGQKVLPIWYQRSIDQEDKLIDFLKDTNALKKYGFYNTSKKAFEIFKASAKKIFVDGANVAHKGRGEKKAEVKNILLVVKELKFRKFEHIVVISDAALRHRLVDAGLLEELKKNCEYLEAPANTSADAFLIESAKKEKGLIVTNDKFADWKAKDKWVKDKIDSLKITFVIASNDNVILSGLEKHTEELLTE